jgi:CspA family cold shock protein
MMGRIRFFNRENGWGFIQPDGRGSDLFFHVSKVMAGGASPKKNGRCTFEVVENTRCGKPQATRVYLGGDVSAET